VGRIFSGAVTVHPGVMERYAERPPPIQVINDRTGRGVAHRLQSGPDWVHEIKHDRAGRRGAVWLSAELQRDKRALSIPHCAAR
jgi:hypothetical protein